jgi:hypothetical protein
LGSGCDAKRRKAAEMRSANTRANESIYVKRIRFSRTFRPGSVSLIAAIHTAERKSLRRILSAHH